jgi:hypothetical protein
VRYQSKLRLLSLALVVAALGASADARAIPVVYAEVYTSNLLGNKHLELTAPTSPPSVAQLLAATSASSLGEGLGSALVTEKSPLAITHTFAPDGFSVNFVKSASLTVSVVDDFDLEKEAVTVDIGAMHVGDASDTLLFELFGGDVLALVDSIGDSFQVTVKATSGDLKVASSLLAVSFDGTRNTGRIVAPPSTPEPAAALVFGLGVALVARRRRA